MMRAQEALRSHGLLKRFARSPFHVTVRREFLPVVAAGVAVFVGGHLAASIIRGNERQGRRGGKEGGGEEEVEDDGAAGIYNRALNRERAAAHRGGSGGVSVPHELWSPRRASLGVDYLGGGHMRCAAMLPSEGRGAEVVESRTGHRATPTFAHVDCATGSVVVGAIAKERRFSDPAATVFDLGHLVAEAHAGGGGRGFGGDGGAAATPYLQQPPPFVARAAGGYREGATTTAGFSLFGTVLSPLSPGRGGGFGGGISAELVHGALLSALLCDASARLDGGGVSASTAKAGGRAKGRGGLTVLGGSTVVVAVPGCLPEPAKGAVLLAAMGQARRDAVRGYAYPLSGEGGGGGEGEGEGEGEGDDVGGAVVVGSIDDAEAALLAAAALGLFDASSGGAEGGGGPVLVVDVGARLVQATLFASAPSPTALERPEGGGGGGGLFGAASWGAAAGGGGEGAEEEEEEKSWARPEVLVRSSSRGEEGGAAVGGDAVVGALVDHLAAAFMVSGEGGAVGDPRNDHLALQRLAAAAEEAVRALGMAPAGGGGGRAHEVHLPFLGLGAARAAAGVAGGFEPRHLDATVTPAALARCAEAALAAVGASAAAPLRGLGAKERGGAGLRVLLAGGGARSPLVREAVAREVGQAWGGAAPCLVVADAPEELTVTGAALAAKHGWVS